MEPRILKTIAAQKGECCVGSRDGDDDDDGDNEGCGDGGSGESVEEGMDDDTEEEEDNGGVVDTCGPVETMPFGRVSSEKAEESNVQANEASMRKVMRRISSAKKKVT